MAPERWREVERLYHAALEHEQDQRAGYLQAVCGTDEALRQEVEGLLAYQGQVHSFLEVPAPDIVAQQQPLNKEQSKERPRGFRLSTGDKLGPYEIQRPLGVGGMGEVYRARDNRLGRTVALKILSAGVMEQAGMRRRFETEAKTISSLNHPHICTLYDLGSQDGVDYVVMEFLEGETLAERLKKGPLPPDQVLEYAIQITDALDTAHRHGVIHRDVKPGNIMMTKKGAKLLDFGLAKVREAKPVVDASKLPTASTPLTGEGMILGTLHYMAPEQLEGHEADTRSDLFALGAVIYEMATGRKAFEGASQASLISAIMNSEPPSISTLQNMTPPALDHVVRTCLAKDPDMRWQNAHDILVQLKWIVAAGSQAAAGGPATALRHTREWLLGALLAAVSLFAAILSVAYFRRPPAQAHAVRFQIPLPENVRMDWFDFPVISPNGQRLILSGVASGGTRHLWLRSLDSLTYELLPETEGAYFPFWSPDNRAIAFFTSSELKRIDAAGGPAQTICHVAFMNQGGAWSRAGVILFSGTNGSGIFRVSATGGEPKTVLQLDKSRQEIGQLMPQFLPDGRHFVYFSQASGRKGGIYAGLLDSKENWRLSSAESNASYAPPGILIYSLRETVVAHSFNLTGLQVTGDAVPIAEHVGRMVEEPVSYYSVSQSGVLAYRSPADDLQLAWYSRDGKRLQSVGEPRRYRQMVLSPDERQLAVELPNGRSELNIWTVDLSTGIFSPLTFAENAEDAVWSPDGRELIFSGNEGVYRKTVGGGGEKLIYKSFEGLFPYDWFKDGRSILLINGGQTFYQLPLAGEQKLLTLMTSGFDKDSPRVSPDEHWVAYSSNESGRWEVYIATFPAFAEKRQVSLGGGCQPFWRKDGKELFYLAFSGKLMAAEVKGGATLQAGAPRVLFQTPARVESGLNQYSITGDGKKFLFEEPIANKGAEQITIVLNWAAGLKK